MDDLEDIQQGGFKVMERSNNCDRVLMELGGLK